MKTALSVFAKILIVFALLAAFPMAPAAAQEDPHAHHHQMAAAPAPEKPEVEALGHLNIPDVPVIDQDGKPRRFYTDLVKGKVVAVNFVFTTCTTICPPMGANFAKLQKLLGDRAGRDIHLISVSVDPSTDTPERMKAWGQKFGAGPGWTRVTGDRAEITRLLKSLGVYTPNISDHSPLVLLGNDARHQWTRAYGLAAPAKLEELISGMAAPAADVNAKKESRP
jgi:protein SCO1/2